MGALPAAAPYAAAILPAPVPYGPAPADTVTQQIIKAPVRTHTVITPQQTNIIPKVNVQNYNVDVPVHVPVPVEREVIVNKHVPAPYEVPVPVHTEQTHVVPGVAHVPTVASYATNAVVGHAAIPAAHGVIGAAHGIVGAAGVIAH